MKKNYSSPLLVICCSALLVMVRTKRLESEKKNKMHEHKTEKAVKRGRETDCRGSVAKKQKEPTRGVGWIK